MQIQTPWVLAEQDIAMHKFNIFVKAAFVDKSFAPPKTYRDDRVAWEIAEVLALHFRGLLKERVQQSPFFGIIVDETTDNSTTQQLILYIKYLNKKLDGDIEVAVEYLDLVCPENGTAEGLVVINNFLID